MIKEFSTLYKGIHKLDYIEKQDKEDKKDRKISLSTGNIILDKKM